MVLISINLSEAEKLYMKRQNLSATSLFRWAINQHKRHRFDPDTFLEDISSLKALTKELEDELNATRRVFKPSLDKEKEIDTILEEIKKESDREDSKHIFPQH